MVTSQEAAPHPSQPNLYLVPFLAGLLLSLNRELSWPALGYG